MPRLKMKTAQRIQDKILDFITDNNGATQNEIAEYMGWTYHNVPRWMKIMVDNNLIFKGIRKEPGATKDDVEFICYYLEP